MSRRRAALLPALALAAGCFGSVAPPGGDPSYAPHVVFASEMKDGDPVDSLGRASLRQRELCLWVQWFDLEEEHHTYHSEIRDGAGQLIHVGDMDLEPGATITWKCHRPNPAFERPGLWEFRIDIDGRLRLERKIVVTAD